MKKWVCKVCGYIYEGPEAPVECPVCHAKNAFNEVQGEIKLAAEHKFGIYADTVKNNPDISEEDKKYIFDQLMANFNGECSEVGMYLCMARIAHREGYPEIRQVCRAAGQRSGVQRDLLHREEPQVARRLRVRRNRRQGGTGYLRQEEQSGRHSRHRP